MRLTTGQLADTEDIARSLRAGESRNHRTPSTVRTGSRLRRSRVETQQVQVVPPPLAASGAGLARVRQELDGLHTTAGHNVSQGRTSSSARSGLRVGTSYAARASNKIELLQMANLSGNRGRSLVAVAVRVGRVGHPET